MHRWVAVLVVAVALLAVGCGSKKSEPETTADWANGVCTATNTWVDSIKTSVGSVTSGGISQSSIQSAGDDMKSATDTLESDLKDLGKPNTEAGEQAKTAIDQLSSDLATDVDSIKTAVDGVSDVNSAITAAATVTMALTTMKTQVTATYTNLKQLDSNGELQTAFQQSSTCTELSNKLSALTTKFSSSG